MGDYKGKQVSPYQTVALLSERMKLGVMMFGLLRAIALLGDEQQEKDLNNTTHLLEGIH